MDKLPLPQNRSGWIAAIILAVFLFLVYYVFLFQGLLNVYEKQFLPISYESVNKSESLALLDIKARIPRYIYSAGTVPIYISVTNRADKPIKNLGIYLVYDDKNDDKIPLLLPNLYNKDTLNSGIVFDEIAPRSTVTGRLFFIAQTSVKIANVSIVADSEYEKRQPSADVTSLTRWNWKALQRSFIETILLPPWSNGFIFALVLFASYLAQSKDCEDDEIKPFTPEFRKCLYNSIEKATWLLLVMLILIASFLHGALFVVLSDGALLYLMIKEAVHSNNKNKKSCIALGVIVILLALALILDIPTSTILSQVSQWGLRKVLMSDMSSEALLMGFFSALSTIESLVLIVFCVKNGHMPEVIQKVIQRGRKTSPPLPIHPPAQTKECPNCHNPNVPEDAKYCPSCGHPFPPQER